MKIEKDRTFTEMNDLRNQLKENMLELQRLQLELNRRNMEKADGSSESLKCLVTSLEKENAQIKKDNGKLEAALKFSTRQSFDRTDIDDNENVNRQLDKFNELEKTLKDACRERDKALQELTRLKQHLLDKLN
ncbi:hypothetical protein QJS10_CPA01g02232 [Acorus calamus]|uniref:Uncharacterized protein n=1 Tax=Acorus calamus TaxID=4465 RepID=A0AAV9FLD6_ACOCL|nr:hypothetical protein QJS10_CPA01g02232 [Acorus calamus]